MLTVIALFVAVLLLVSFEATRLIGAAGIVLLIVFYPLAALAIVLVAGVALYFTYQRRLKTYAPPQLDD
jgi:hypothetical protein